MLYSIERADIVRIGGREPQDSQLGKTSKESLTQRNPSCNKRQGRGIMRLAPSRTRHFNARNKNAISTQCPYLKSPRQPPPAREPPHTPARRISAQACRHDSQCRTCYLLITTHVSSWTPKRQKTARGSRQPREAALTPRPHRHERQDAEEPSASCCLDARRRTPAAQSTAPQRIMRWWEARVTQQPYPTPAPAPAPAPAPVARRSAPAV